MRNISLIGYRGTGKSTVGKVLAERLGYSFVDTDDEVEQRAGCSIAEIFARQGEAVFRDLEADVISEAAARERRVVSLGGGAILRAENRERIAGSGPVVWLRARVETIAQRLRLDDATASRRPHLTSHGGGLTEIEQVLRERLPLYEATASVVVDVDLLTPEAIVTAILSQLD